MRVLRSPPTLPPTIFETFPRPGKPRFIQTQPITPFIDSTALRPVAVKHQIRKMSTTSPDFAQYGVETTSIPTNAGVSLSPAQQLLTGSVLDLFAGRPTKRKLTLWANDASFHDPLTNSHGRKQYEAQWYGLKAAFSEIERLNASVRSAGNPIELDLKTRYKVKGIGSEQTIESVVAITTQGEGEQMKIKKVEDRWGGEIKEGPFKNALRAINASTVPALVSVPSSVEEEEAAMKKS